MRIIDSFPAAFIKSSLGSKYLSCYRVFPFLYMMYAKIEDGGAYFDSTKLVFFFSTTFISKTQLVYTITSLKDIILNVLLERAQMLLQTTHNHSKFRELLVNLLYSI